MAGFQDLMQKHPELFGAQYEGRMIVCAMIVNSAFRFKIDLAQDGVVMLYEGEFSQVAHIFAWLIAESFMLDEGTPQIGVHVQQQHYQTDPELYSNLKRPYSRVCQGKRKPIPMQRPDGENVTEYWNYTTQQPQYYKCSKHFPYFYFITDLHKKNYCVPCCSQYQGQFINNNKLY